MDLSKKENNQIKINKMSSAGIGNAALGSMASDFLISTFTPEANKPATRGQMNQLINKIKRYQEIRNHPDNVRGEKAYYDNELKIIVFRKKSFS
ncbi:hypothetical protein [Polaribacter marinivivus]|uniref:Uncharacterized protein n=1 Tax=Polaribacter marinivivus TaxID=1524260 RepID=A0ABV8R5S8_9FLAO